MSEADTTSKRLERHGLFATKVYLLFLIGGIPVAAYFGILELQSLKLNELGDFLAGAFGPLAIFWLVLGFFQQGQELRNSVNTLKLQAEELKNSVEQQERLVNVTSETLDHERAQQAERENARQLNILPKFNILARGGSRQGGPNGRVKNTITISNVGADVSGVYIELVPTPEMIDFPRTSFWKRGLEIRFQVQFEKAGPLKGEAKMYITYSNSDGAELTSVYSLVPESTEPTSLIVAPIRLDYPTEP